ncbi:MAG: polymerase III, gamma and tau subunit protein [Candidatus Yanofskybacteria bacterium GW2011_GWF1_44_227]|uniref:DNA polymerase III subunit gamma/tau n=1 Tax=Candidatus Yanofskybacteria bacterium GW2011_GWE2_40_11 TaxID=1619033 RepID=A0A0G0QL31_9BACT|nr:MAG: polymerase III, gamma and tau subunit protein [Candidatus Yanofskybacteria bacterium GW2011_GWE1_40_10]KKR41104.1 MAG: polymerase III, gamma and tau subunit protein [Candidatus Yanofskybacteria bacterium GW2011_GWE2_40_11]KKT15898.1 MAG: polymerase III, gamma and tau subunit protein [Candidatus Yanofskybacteria bacterium GW2011_GWF2_43_596]KKT53588.1 MAG: polymerase III, gamma and tau subunit protein [Candidatus Yanofskybacteria bacterium GW2011_GWF1_44_227]OGN36284.1 MAG: DNA polymeras
MLYRKYRPQTFAEVVGQDHIIKTLTGGLISGRIGHAYLFTGPRGTGKTSVARVFAKSLNCHNLSKDGNPDNKCDSCSIMNEGRSMDLIEIDAASNRGIEDIRNLKESALVAAPSGKYKVFIIDEVHMLSKDAFNALLKILEEPPAHVIFILATTESHKILPTVLSRVQRFDFKRLTTDQIFNKIKDVARIEKIKIGDDSLRSMAISADGALRDAEVYLSKIRAAYPLGQEVTAKDVIETLGLIPADYFPKFVSLIFNSEKEKAIEFISDIHGSGVDLDNFSKGLIEYLRKVLISKISPATLAAYFSDVEISSDANFTHQIDPKLVVRMIASFSNARNEMKTSPIPTLSLELAVMDVLGFS